MADSRTHSLAVFTGTVAIFLVMIALGCARTGEGAEASTRPAQGTAPAPVVIELFTSEGCSSCPPADDLLADLIGAGRPEAARGESPGQPVYAMAFHVDYWNGLGWRDRFSSGEFSARQRKYAAAFGSDQVYTPQMVINGKSGFVGSDATEARKQIRAAVDGPIMTEVVMKAEKAPDGRFTIAYTVRDAPKGTVLNIALVERSATTRVERGENGGRTLRHANVVRAFNTVSLSGSNTGKIDLNPPESLDANNALLIGFVQDEKSMAVVGASSADVPP